MGEFVRKGNNYYRNNSDGTQTQVTPTEDGYFHWVQPDGKRVRSQKRYKIDPIADFTIDEYGNAYQWGRPLSPERKVIKGDASENFLNNLMAGGAGIARAAAIAVPPVLTPQTVMGGVEQLPWWQTAIGTAAGSMATGMTADEVSKSIVGKLLEIILDKEYWLLLPSHTNLYYRLFPNRFGIQLILFIQLIPQVTFQKD